MIRLVGLVILFFVNCGQDCIVDPLDPDVCSARISPSVAYSVRGAEVRSEVQPPKKYCLENLIGRFDNMYRVNLQGYVLLLTEDAFLCPWSDGLKCSGFTDATNKTIRVVWFTKDGRGTSLWHELYHVHLVQEGLGIDSEHLNSRWGSFNTPACEEETIDEQVNSGASW